MRLGDSPPSTRRDAKGIKKSLTQRHEDTKRKQRGKRGNGEMGKWGKGQREGIDRIHKINLKILLIMSEETLGKPIKSAAKSDVANPKSSANDATVWEENQRLF